MSKRAEAGRIAAELAKERGGRLTDHIGEAWSIVNGDKKKKATKTKKPKATKKEPKRKAIKLAGKVTKGAAKKVTQKSKIIAGQLNFFKAPKDSPKIISDGAKELVTKRPDKLELSSFTVQELNRILNFR